MTELTFAGYDVESPPTHDEHACLIRMPNQSFTGLLYRYQTLDKIAEFIHSETTVGEYVTIGDESRETEPSVIPAVGMLTRLMGDTYAMSSEEYPTIVAHEDEWLELVGAFKRQSFEEYVRELFECEHLDHCVTDDTCDDAELEFRTNFFISDDRSVFSDPNINIEYVMKRGEDSLMEHQGDVEWESYISMGLSDNR